MLGQYELVLLDEAAGDQPPRLLFVLPNLGEAVARFDADEREFMTWVTLHEVTHAVQFASVPWLHPHLAGLVRELLEQRRAADREPAALSAPAAATTSRASAVPSATADLIELVASEAERGTIDRCRR